MVGAPSFAMGAGKALHSFTVGVREAGPWVFGAGGSVRAYPRTQLSEGADDETHEGVLSEGGVALGVRGVDGRAHRDVAAARLGHGTVGVGGESPLAIDCRQRVYAPQGRILCRPTGGQTKSRLVHIGNAPDEHF
jgi:hypothetical protein